jgi:hypothetical protein
MVREITGNPAKFEWESPGVQIVVTSASIYVSSLSHHPIAKFFLQQNLFSLVNKYKNR